MEKLATRLEEMEENEEEIQKMVTYMFKSVFVHRYRDVVDDIRCVCLTELGVWIMECPVLFMEDSYLKYLGWPLHDKVGSVRLCAIKSLLSLYVCRDMKDKLVLFTEKFKDRLVSLVLDKDLEVAVCGIQLLQALAKYQPNSLTDNHCEMVYELVYSTHRTVARAAGSFLQQRLFMPSLAAEKVRTKRGKMRLSNTPLLRDLVQFFIESDRPGYEAYLVDSLIDNPMVKDWECMTDLLVEECGPGEEDLDDSQETALIMLMVASMKQVVMGEDPPGRGSATGKRVQTAKDIRQMAREKEMLTNHFMAILPSLIHKYLPDQVKVSKLLTIPQFMNLEMFTTSRQERALDGLLKLLTEVVEKHTEEQVLGEAFKMMELLCCPHSASYGKCDAKREQLVEVMLMQFKMRLEEYTSFLTEDDEPGDEERFTYELSLLKLRLLCKHHDLGEREVWELLLDILRRGVESNQQDMSRWGSEEATLSVLLCCFYSLMWDKKADRRRDLRSKVDRFMMLCREVVVHVPASMLAEEAFISICDLLVVFGGDEELVRPNAAMVEELVRYLEEKVFTDMERREMEVQDDEDARVEKLLRKR
jgi:cohesin complex subunit SA-1/2